MKTRTLTALAMIGLFVAVPTLMAAPASANSALEQYVEEVPTPEGGNKTGTGTEKPPTKPLDPEVEKQLQSSGDDGASLGQVAAATAPTVAMNHAPGARSGKPGHKGSHAVKEHKGSKRGELSKLLVADSPGAAESWTAAAGSSGVNGPLAVFVALVALLMGGFAYRRHLRSRSR